MKVPKIGVPHVTMGFNPKMVYDLDDLGIFRGF